MVSLARSVAATSFVLLSLLALPAIAQRPPREPANDTAFNDNDDRDPPHISPFAPPTSTAQAAPAVASRELPRPQGSIVGHAETTTENEFSWTRFFVVGGFSLGGIIVLAVVAAKDKRKSPTANAQRAMRRVSMSFDLRAFSEIESEIDASVAKFANDGPDGQRYALGITVVQLERFAEKASHASWSHAEVTEADLAERLELARREFSSSNASTSQARFTVVSVLVGAHAQLDAMPGTVTRTTLRHALKALVPTRATDVLRFELLWSHVVDEDPKTTDLECPHFALARLDGARKGQVTCAFCLNKYDAKRNECSSCGAPAGA